MLHFTKAQNSKDYRGEKNNLRFKPLNHLIADFKMNAEDHICTAGAVMTHVIQGCGWLMGTFAC